MSFLNKERREKSIQEMRKCVDDAYFYGSHSVLINSGRRPDNGKDKIAYEYLKKSIKGLLKFIEREAR